MHKFTKHGGAKPSLREHLVFSALVSCFTRREKPSSKPRREKISVSSAGSDQSQFTLHIRRSNARVFEWISRKRVGKYSGRRVEERMGSFRVWKTQQASRGSLGTCCWIKERCFRESSSGFGKSVVFQALPIVYSYVEPTREKNIVGETSN